MKSQWPTSQRQLHLRPLPGNPGNHTGSHIGKLENHNGQGETIKYPFFCLLSLRISDIHIDNSSGTPLFMARCVASPVRGDLGDAPGLDHAQLLQQVLAQGGSQHLGCNCCQQRRNGKPQTKCFSEFRIVCYVCCWRMPFCWVMTSIRSLDLIGKIVYNMFTIPKGK